MSIPLDVAGQLLSLADISVKIAVLVALAGLVSLALRRAAAATRHTVWLSALIASLALPPIGFLVPTQIGTRLPISVPTATAVPARQPVVAPGPISLPQHSGAPGPTPASPTLADLDNASPTLGAAPAQAGQPSVIVMALCLVYGLGAVCVLAQVAMGALAVRRLERRAAAADAEGKAARILTSALAEIDDRRRRSVRLLMLAGAVPMTWGWRKPVVLLPEDADDWADERLRVVLLHELAHIVRRDWPIQMLAQIVCALYWFHPLVWVAAARLRAESESACDDRVLLAGVAGDAYAEHLLAIAELARRQHVDGGMGFAASMARPTGMRVRIQAALDGRRRRIIGTGRRGAGFAMAGGMCLASTAGLLHLTLIAVMERFHRIPPVLVPGLTYRLDGVSPRVYLSDGRVVAEKEVLRPLEDMPEDAHWTHALGNGLTVELVGLSERHDLHQAEWNNKYPTIFQEEDGLIGGLDSPWSLWHTEKFDQPGDVSWNSWRPEGTPIATPLYDPLGSHIITWPQPETHRAVEVDYRIKGAGAEEPAMQAMSPDSTWGGATAYPRNNTYSPLDILAHTNLVVSNTLDFVDLTFWIAVGAPEHTYVAPRSHWNFVERRDPYLRGVAGGTVLCVAPPQKLPRGFGFAVYDRLYNPPDSPYGYERQFFAVDHKGRKHRASVSGVGAGGHWIYNWITFSDDNLLLADVDHLEMDTRTYQQTTFRHVAVCPGRIEK